MDVEQVDKYTETLVRCLCATNLIQINDRRRAVGVIKQALTQAIQSEQANLNIYLIKPKSDT